MSGLADDEDEALADDDDNEVWSGNRMVRISKPISLKNELFAKAKRSCNCALVQVCFVNECKCCARVSSGRQPCAAKT